MGGTLSVLNQSLHDQLARLNDPSIKGDALKEEIERASSMVTVSKEINSVATRYLDAAKLKAEYRGLTTEDTASLDQLTGGGEKAQEQITG